MGKSSLDASETGSAQNLGEALMRGQVNFKRSKYDMPDPKDKALEKAKRHAKATKGRGGHIFGAPAEHNPNMDYISADPNQGGTSGHGSWAQAAMHLNRQMQTIKKTVAPKTKLKKSNCNAIDGMIDDLLKSTK